MQTKVGIYIFHCWVSISQYQRGCLRLRGFGTTALSSRGPLNNPRFTI